MITMSSGNLLKADVEALVNTVNCVGFMGKGIALQFKQAFPENFKAYEKACRAAEVCPGHMLVFKTGMLGNPKYIINFPTKRHWRGSARIEDVRSGLVALVQEVRKLGIRSIAVPPLGCGLGGLNWEDVRPLIEAALSEVPEVCVHLYAPLGAPAAKAMPVRTARPRMTPGRAMVVRLMAQYLQQSYRLTLLEIQKLGYFLQEAGEKLRLNYVPHIYGPYAANLNKVLEAMEGHYTRGYGDSQKPDVEVELLPGAVQEADEFLLNHEASRSRLAKVAALIEGFETPYGMELLSTVHWVATHGDVPVNDVGAAVDAVHGWNERKRQMFGRDHIEVVWQQLCEQGWLPETVRS
jgi:O-acetyl-ADP-ribose deacetylase (regulator of RNase III)